MRKEYNYHTFIMGCNFDMTFITDSVKQADKYFAKSLVIAREFEQRFSRFNINSELSKLNKQKRAVVSAEFLNVWLIAYDLYKKTEGVFNPLVQVATIGYDKTFKDLIKNSRRKSSLSYNTNMDEVVVVGNEIILQKNQKLDFGGFLKGHVAQIITENFSDIPGVIINIGGDIYSRGTVFNMEIINPLKNGKNIKVHLKNQSLCTSGVYKRKWTINGKGNHHIVDTKTKTSTETKIISASVLCTNGSRADAYATMAIIMGIKEAKIFLKKRNISCVLICTDGAIIKTGDINKIQ